MKDMVWKVTERETRKTSYDTLFMDRDDAEHFYDSVKSKNYSVKLVNKIDGKWKVIKNYYNSNKDVFDYGKYNRKQRHSEETLFGFRK